MSVCCLLSPPMQFFSMPLIGHQIRSDPGLPLVDPPPPPTYPPPTKKNYTPPPFFLLKKIMKPLSQIGTQILCLIFWHYAIICTHRESWCLPYAGFFLSSKTCLLAFLVDPKLLTKSVYWQEYFETKLQLNLWLKKFKLWQNFKNITVITKKWQKKLKQIVTKLNLTKS